MNLTRQYRLIFPSNTATVLFISFYILGIGLTKASNSSRNM